MVELILNLHTTTTKASLQMLYGNYPYNIFMYNVFDKDPCIDN